MARLSNILKEDLGNAVTEALDNTKEHNAGHFQTLLGEREHGSRWGRELTEQELYSLARTAQKITEKQEGMMPMVDYYSIDLTDFNATQDIILGKDITADVEVVYGQHGKMLGAKESVEGHGVNSGIIIVGPAEDEQKNPVKGIKMIWTLFPGQLSTKIPTDFIDKYQVGDTIEKSEIIEAGGDNWAIKRI
jgi:hypothetical protein